MGMGRRRRGEKIYGFVDMGQGEGGILLVQPIGLLRTGRLRLTGSLGDVCFSFSLPIFRVC